MRKSSLFNARTGVGNKKKRKETAQKDRIMYIVQLNINGMCYEQIQTYTEKQRNQNACKKKLGNNPT